LLLRSALPILAPPNALSQLNSGSVELRSLGRAANAKIEYSISELAIGVLSGRFDLFAEGDLMNMSILKTTIAVILVALAGCASQKDLDATRAVADRAVQDAAAAKAAADAAMAAANSAASQGKAAAAAAQSTANQALQAAQASQACCDATNEKMTRMFQKSVSK